MCPWLQFHLGYPPTCPFQPFVHFHFARATPRSQTNLAPVCINLNSPSFLLYGLLAIKHSGGLISRFPVRNTPLARVTSQPGCPLRTGAWPQGPGKTPKGVSTRASGASGQRHVQVSGEGTSKPGAPVFSR